MMRTMLLGEFNWSRAITLLERGFLERGSKRQSFVSLGRPFQISYRALLVCVGMLLGQQMAPSTNSPGDASCCP